MQLIPVTDRKTRKAFHALPKKIYQDDPNWIRPWKHEIEKVFDPAQNPFFEHGEATRWILKNDQGEVIGRVGAFINREECDTFDQPTGGMGFFECIDDQEAAFALFDQCKKWLAERGMEAMDGPINFGAKNNWWGLLVEGFTPPPYGFNYHPPYYQALFEAYGFQTYYEQYNYYRPVMTDFRPAYKRIAGRILKNPAYTFPKFSRKEKDKFSHAFRKIYNEAWVTHEAYKPMSEAQAKSIIKQMLPILDEDMIIFAFYKDEPVAFFVCIPEINQLIKYLNGNFDLLAKLKFLYHQRRGAVKRLFGIAYGVVPSQQRKGLEVAMALHAQEVCQALNRYDDFEMGWLGDFNPVMLKMADIVNCTRYRTFITYRKLFDESKPFKRRPVIGE